MTNNSEDVYSELTPEQIQARRTDWALKRGRAEPLSRAAVAAHMATEIESEEAAERRRRAWAAVHDFCRYARNGPVRRNEFHKLRRRVRKLERGLFNG